MESTVNHFLAITFLLTLSWDGFQGARLLLVPMPAASHIYPLTLVDDALQAKYNHTTTYVLPKYLMSSPLLKSGKRRVVRAHRLEKSNFYTLAEQVLEKSIQGEFPVFDIIKMFSGVCHDVLGDAKLMDELIKGKFDLVLIQPGFASDCLNFLAYKLSIPFVHIGDYYDCMSMGIPCNPAVIPTFPFAEFGQSMTFIQRLQNHGFSVMKSIADTFIFKSDLSSTYVPEKPFISIKDLRSQLQFSLYDFDVLMDYPRQTMPNGAFVGGLNTQPAKPLNKDFQRIMDSATDGVIVVSFGHLLDSFLGSEVNKMLVALKKMKPIKFIIKTGKEKSEDENIIKRPWIPQNDLLGHKNTKAFITHCGNGAQYEALYHGVPMIGVPVNGDQFYNAERMRSKQYGLVMKLRSIDTDSFVKVVQEVVNNPTYKTSISKASQIFRFRPETPSERAAYWIDHVIKYGGDYMKSVGPSLPWYTYFGVDVCFFFIICICMVIVFLRLVFRCVKKCLCAKKKEKLS